MGTQTQLAVGRQGIYDGAGLVGYELLFRNVDRVGSAGLRPDQMTAGVIVDALSIGIDRLAGDKPMFINAERRLLTNDLPTVLPPERTVLQILGGVEVDDAVLAGCRRLVADGHTLALDDFTVGSDHERLLPLASIVKVDVMSTPPAQLERAVALCRTHGVRPLADRVTNQGSLAGLAELGFELFQGPALDLPKIVPGRTLTATSLASLVSAAGVLGCEDLDVMEEILRRDPGLTYQVVQLASLGRRGETRRPVRTIRDALVLAGTVRVSNWVSLMMIRSSQIAPPDDAVVRTLQRAKACELLADAARLEQRALAFTAGMLSGLDLLLQVDPAEVLGDLSLSDELRDAAFGCEGELAGLVREVVARQNVLAPAADAPSLRAHALDEALSAGLAWALESTDHFGGARVAS